MRPPASLSPAARKSWTNHVAHLSESGAWCEETDAAILERMLQHREAAVDALEAAQSEPWVTGSTGQLVAHPGFAVAAREEQVAMALARQLDLGPAGRRLRSGAGDGDDKSEADPFEEFDELATRRAKRPA